MIYDEILDIVSLEDTVIGQEKRSKVYLDKSSCFRVINAFICNSEKKLWIPRRHKNKKLFPLYLDASVGGHVMSGETYQEAFMRESNEELNLDFENNSYNYKAIARLTPHEHKTSAFMWVYIIYSDIAPDYNTDDFNGFEWLYPEEIFDKLANGDKAKSDLVPILNNIKYRL